MRLLACLDGSDYAAAVCDYAAWLAGPTEQAIDLLHAVEDPTDAAFKQADGILNFAARRLGDLGLEDVRRVTQRGAFVEIAGSMAESHSILVLGKRGVSGEGDRRLLGSNVEPLLRGTTQPVCLVSNVFLPVSRALVLLDADITHRRTVEFVCDHPWISDLDPDVVVMTDGDGEKKLAWARAMLGAGGADIYPLSADGPHQALERYREEHPVDLLVLSREVALADDAAPLRQIEADSLWAWRAPALIC